MNTKTKIQLWTDELGYYADCACSWDNSAKRLLALYKTVKDFKPERIIVLGVGEGLELRVAGQCLSPDKITAVEIDRDGFDDSQKIVPDDTRKIKIIERDMRRVDLSQLICSEEKILVIASAKYSDTSKTIMRKILPLLSDCSAVLISGPVILEGKEQEETLIKEYIRNNKNPLKCSDWVYSRLDTDKILAAPKGFSPLLNYKLSLPAPGFAVLRNETLTQAEKLKTVKNFSFNPLSFLGSREQKLFNQTRLFELIDSLSSENNNNAKEQAAIAVCAIRLGLWDKAAQMLTQAKRARKNKAPAGTLKSLEKIIKTKLRLIRTKENEASEITLFTLLAPGQSNLDENIIQSWQTSAQNVRILVFGFFDKEHEDKKISYIPMPADENGNVFVPVLFALAKQKSDSDILCFFRPDTKPSNNIVPAITRIRKHFDSFLACGKSRLNGTDESLPSGKTDYLIFTKDLWPAIPPFIMDTSRAWTSWMIFNALASRINVIDTSDAIRILAPAPAKQPPQSANYNKSLVNRDILALGKCSSAPNILKKDGFHIRTSPDKT